MHLILIPADAVPKLWHMAAKLLEICTSRTHGATTPEAELQHIMASKKQLWLIVDQDTKADPLAAGITSLQKNEDGSLTANIEFLGGENMKQWFSLKGTFEDWAKAEGCSDIRLWARKGWARHLDDFTITHYMMRKEL